ncbi:transposase [Trinickia terrae]|uniref:Transposase n=2 Tax=Trinickia terrae TaxID=2571161 RepID=A0A4U1IG55_9BURK|nr:transposase [Trinickia terrae]
MAKPAPRARRFAFAGSTPVRRRRTSRRRSSSIRPRARRRFMRTGEGWSRLPVRYPPYQTCHRRYQRWQKEGVLRQLVERLYGEYGLALHLSLINRSRHRDRAADERGTQAADVQAR